MSEKIILVYCPKSTKPTKLEWANQCLKPIPDTWRCTKCGEIHLPYKKGTS